METFSVNNHFQMSRPPEPISEAPPARQRAPETPQPPKPTAPKAEDIEKAAAELQKRFQVKVELGSDEDTGRMVARIMSPDGERVIRQIPAETVMELAERAKDHSGEGLLNSMV